MAWDYSEKLKEHFFNPRNILQQTEEEYNPDGVGMVGNVKCGDMMKMLIKVGENDTIADCKWQTYGCASAIGSTSILSTMVIGKSLDEAMKIGPQEIAAELGGLPAQKFHCSVLGDKALRAAAADYYRRNGKEDKITWTGSEVICNCLNVTRDEIEELVAHGVTEFSELQERTKLGTSCGSCKDNAMQLLEELRKKYHPQSCETEVKS